MIRAGIYISKSGSYTATCSLQFSEDDGKDKVNAIRADGILYGEDERMDRFSYINARIHINVSRESILRALSGVGGRWVSIFDFYQRYDVYDLMEAIFHDKRNLIVRPVSPGGAYSELIEQIRVNGTYIPLNEYINRYNQYFGEISIMHSANDELYGTSTRHIYMQNYYSDGEGDYINDYDDFDVENFMFSRDLHKIPAKRVVHIRNVGITKPPLNGKGRPKIVTSGVLGKFNIDIYNEVWVEDSTYSFAPKDMSNVLSQIQRHHARSI